MKRRGKRFLAAVLCAVMTLSLGACENRQETGAGNPAGEGKEFVYVPEYIAAEAAEKIVSYGSNILDGDQLYYIDYTYDEQNGTATNLLKAYSLEDGSTKEALLELTEFQNIMNYALDSEKNMVALVSEYDAEAAAGDEAYMPDTLLVRFDGEGKKTFSGNITDLLKGDDGQPGYVGSIAVDGDHNVYVRMDSKILLLNQEGEKQGEVSPDNGWIDTMVQGNDGKVYVSCYENGGTANRVLAAVDWKEKKLGEPLRNFPAGNGANTGANDVAVGQDNLFYVNDGNKIYRYDASAQTSEEVCSWLDSDINGSYVDFYGVTGNGGILAIIRDWGTKKTEIAKLIRTKASEMEQKEQIVIGTLSQNVENMQLQQAVVDFNKSSDKYRVTIRTYLNQNDQSESSREDALTNLNKDLLSKNNCPDIMDLSEIDEEALTAKGVFEDLYPFLEKSSVLGKDDFMDTILDSYSKDGKLYSIPAGFSLSTIAGKSSIVGKEMGWSLADMIACAKEHPNAKLFEGMDQNGLLGSCLIYNQDSFINWDKKECYFEGDEFKQLLEFVQMFPDETGRTDGDSSIVEKLQKDEVLFEKVSIFGFNDVQLYPFMFGGEEVTYIGYPTTDGSVGCMLETNSRYGISKQSEHKEGAWAFIESYLMGSNADSVFFYSLSTRKDEFDKQAEIATEPNYYLDENGEQVMDENGEPMQITSIGYMDGWEYTYHTPTEEDVETVKLLLSVAKPAARRNQQINDIIQEEAAPFFQGQKSADDVMKIIQSRVQLYISENK